MNAAETTAAIVDRLVAQIEAGAGDFTMPWHQLAAVGLPRNATTANTYSGINVMALWLTAIDRSYPTPLWATYRQWSNLGGQVRKGEHSTHCVRWVTKTSNDHHDDDGDGDGEKDESRRRAFPVGFSLFNIAQVDGVELPAAPAKFGTGPDRNGAISEWFDNVPATVTWGVGHAAYNPVADQVVMPHWETFTSTDGAYSTLAHELAHWTGHPTRLDRAYGERFGDDAYAIEELTAELSAAFTCSTLGIDVLARPDHAAYLASWCRVLRAEPNTLHTVAGKAQAATDHLTNYQPTHRASTRAPGDDR